MFKNMKIRLKSQRGFTLVELLAVIVILGIIAAIAVPAIGNIIDNSRKDAAISDALMVINGAKLAQAAGEGNSDTDGSKDVIIWYGPNGGGDTENDLINYISNSEDFISVKYNIDDSEYSIQGHEGLSDEFDASSDFASGDVTEAELLAGRDGTASVGEDGEDGGGE